MQDQVLEQYFTAIKEDFNHTEDRFDGMDRRFDSVEKRLDRIESICFAILEIVKAQDFKFKEFNSRLLRLENKIV